MALLHVQTNFLEREFRFDSSFQQNRGSDSTKSVDFDGCVDCLWFGSQVHGGSGRQL